MLQLEHWWLVVFLFVLMLPQLVAISGAAASHVRRT